MLVLFVASTISLVPMATQEFVSIQYQNTYVSPDELAAMPPEVAAQFDPKTGETVMELLGGDGKGVPSLSHTWITAERRMDFRWNGKSAHYREAETLSWLPRGAFIAPQASWQEGANYDLSSTEEYLQAAITAPLAEAAIIADQIRTQGPAVGWATAEAEHPILNRPVLGIIPRRIAERQIEARVQDFASYFDWLTYNARYVIERAAMPAIAVNEDFFLAVRARREQLESRIAYSMFEGVQRLGLGAEDGATNCHSAALDFLTGGDSAQGAVPFYELGTTRGRTVAQILASVFALHGPTYVLAPATRAAYDLEARAVAPRLQGTRAGGVCSCQDAAGICKIDLDRAGRYTAGGSCANVCSPLGSALPLLLANCATVKLPD